MGLIKTAVKTAVAVKTAHVVHERIQRRQQTEWSPADGAEPSPPPQASAGADAPAPDRLSQLERLANLRSAGALSDAEFELEKARILQG
ncbi:SHOCT domain-containing protein [Streptacidiphilus melanogenes]|uniref:SHOCT domain-containing protein n=1 Tax=Streptacidiphilus melanogenes TaxID=411235 RepID=UPI0005A60213|nr:SHOCT domain-containing protein [Streptacidiphilus melanogenes]